MYRDAMRRAMLTDFMSDGDWGQYDRRMIFDLRDALQDHQRRLAQRLEQVEDDQLQEYHCIQWRMDRLLERVNDRIQGHFNPRGIRDRYDDADRHDDGGPEERREENDENSTPGPIRQDRQHNRRHNQNQPYTRRLHGPRESDGIETVKSGGCGSEDVDEDVALKMSTEAALHMVVQNQNQLDGDSNAAALNLTFKNDGVKKEGEEEKVVGTQHERNSHTSGSISPSGSIPEKFGKAIGDKIFPLQKMNDAKQREEEEDVALKMTTEAALHMVVQNQNQLDGDSNAAALNLTFKNDGVKKEGEEEKVVGTQHERNSHTSGSISPSGSIPEKFGKAIGDKIFPLQKMNDAKQREEEEDVALKMTTEAALHMVVQNQNQLDGDSNAAALNLTFKNDGVKKEGEEEKVVGTQHERNSHTSGSISPSGSIPEKFGKAIGDKIFPLQKMNDAKQREEEEDVALKMTTEAALHMVVQNQNQLDGDSNAAALNLTFKNDGVKKEGEEKKVVGTQHERNSHTSGSISPSGSIPEGFGKAIGDKIFPLQTLLVRSNDNSEFVPQLPVREIVNEPHQIILNLLRTAAPI